MFILLIDVDDDTRFVVFNDLSLHDKRLLYRNSTKNVVVMQNTANNPSTHIHRASIGDILK
jgi:hypothetical protein